MVKVAPLLVQAPELENVTGLPEPPPLAATVKLEPTAALAGACVVIVIAWSAFATVSESVSLLGSWPASPANDAPTPVGYEPASMPARLTLLTVATPFASVVAPPALEPLRVNATLAPATGSPPDVSVAVSVVVPPNVPVAGETPSVV